MRYIDADQLIKKIYPMGIGDGMYVINAKAIKFAIDNTPTADVVPKSEVEMLQGALKAEERHNELTMEMAKKALANAKAEVAREIFEEIETCMKNFEDDDDGYLLKKCEFEFFMRELKKIYAEEKE